MASTSVRGDTKHEALILTSHITKGCPALRDTSTQLSSNSRSKRTKAKRRSIDTFSENESSHGRRTHGTAQEDGKGAAGSPRSNTLKRRHIKAKKRVKTAITGVKRGRLQEAVGLGPWITRLRKGRPRNSPKSKHVGSGSG